MSVVSLINHYETVLAHTLFMNFPMKDSSYKSDFLKFS